MQSPIHQAGKAIRRSMRRGIHLPLLHHGKRPGPVHGEAALCEGPDVLKHLLCNIVRQIEGCTLHVTALALKVDRTKWTPAANDGASSQRSSMKAAHSWAEQSLRTACDWGMTSVISIEGLTCWPSASDGSRRTRPTLSAACGSSRLRTMTNTCAGCVIRPARDMTRTVVKPGCCVSRLHTTGSCQRLLPVQSQLLQLH